MLGQLSKQLLWNRWLAATVGAGVDGAIVESAAIDCAGYDRMLATLDLGATATQNGTVKFYLEECATSGGSYTALAGATVGASGHLNGASDAAKTLLIDAKLNLRYVKIVYQREVSNTILNGGIALLYNNKISPITGAAVLIENVVT